jgi:hypothetical protein
MSCFVSANNTQVRPSVTCTQTTTTKFIVRTSSFCKLVNLSNKNF